MHRLGPVDDSGLSAVVQCTCGWGWIEVGEDRDAEVRHMAAAHVIARRAEERQPRTPPVPDEVIVTALEAGESAKAIVRRLRTDPRRVALLRDLHRIPMHTPRGKWAA